MTIRTIMMVVMTLVLVYVVWDTAKYLGLIGNKTASKKAVRDIRKEQSVIKNRARVIKTVVFLTWVDENYGFKVNTYTREDLSTRIKRLNIKVKSLNRHAKVTELLGVFKALSFLGFLATSLIFFTVGGLFTLAPIPFIFTRQLFVWLSDYTLYAEDIEMEQEFGEFYFTLHSKLMSDSPNRLAPFIKDFIDAHNSMYHKRDNAIMYRFAIDFITLLELYQDDTLALKELRKKYTSVTFINFSNIAIQRLQGIDNRDKLLSYAIELQRKTNEKIEVKASKAIFKGTIAIYAIFFLVIKYVIFAIYLKAEVMLSFT